jgi:SAM-dependent methyltransferase
MSQRDHYSYAHYADTTVAEDFDALRFGGPIGRLLLDTQAQLLHDALAPAKRHLIADVGTGTGRAAIGLAAAGARAIGLDFSEEMLGVARARAMTARAAHVTFARADAHALPLAAQSVDAAVSLRVLMHAIDWRRCLAELCRIARWRVVVDFPSSRSLAAIESAVRRRRLAAGQRVEAYRVMREGQIREEFARHGFYVVSVHRQFVLPIALHKAIGRRSVTRAVEGALAAVGLLRAFGSPVTMVAERAGGGGP